MNHGCVFRDSSAIAAAAKMAVPLIAMPRPRADPGRIGDQRHGDEAEGGRGEESLAFADELALLLLERPQLARIGNRVADVAQDPKELFGPRDLGIVFDQRLFMRETDRNLIDPRPASQRLLYRASTKRAMKAANAGANTNPVGPLGRFFAPVMEIGI